MCKVLQRDWNKTCKPDWDSLENFSQTIWINIDVAAANKKTLKNVKKSWQPDAEPFKLRRQPMKINLECHRQWCFPYPKAIWIT